MQSFLFNICGYANFRCLPQGYPERYQYGSAIQAWDAPPACNPADNTTMCWSAADQTFECCTQPCEVIGGECCYIGGAQRAGTANATRSARPATPICALRCLYPLRLCPSSAPHLQWARPSGR
jgi:hypothetical protein